AWAQPRQPAVPARRSDPQTPPPSDSSRPLQSLADDRGESSTRQPLQRHAVGCYTARPNSTNKRSRRICLLAGYFPARHRIDLVDLAEPVLDRAAPEPRTPGDIIFQPEISCLCGSDLPYFNAEHPEFTHRQIGHSLHEMTGTVVATNGKKFRPGDKVLAVPVNQCGLFERYVLSEARAIPVDPRLPRERACLSQPRGTVMCALKKLPQILDKDVVIVGQGPIGQMFTASFRNLGAREIIAVERIESRLALSPTMGATATINADKSDVAAEVARITRG